MNDAHEATENDHGRGGLDRRGFLRRAGLVAGASAALPLLGAAGHAAAAAGASAAPAAGTDAGAGTGGDADQLFKAGAFAAAERAYTRLWRADPGDAHAAAQLGYLNLLSNRFAPAEYHLGRALRLAPDDTLSAARLADCFVRQDLFDRAVPLLPDAQATQLSSVTGTPNEARGAQATRVPFLDLDPLPRVAASVNGTAPGAFVLDTGASNLVLTAEAAADAGLRAVSSTTSGINGRTVTTFLGVAASVRIGEIELRNVPVSWVDGPALAFPDGVATAGTIGTTVLYHFLATMDYKGRALVLRRRTPAQQRAFRAEAARAGIRPQPLWLADHLPCTLARLNDYGPRVAVIDSGGIGHGLDTSAANAERAGMSVDWSHPTPINGGTATVYPADADRMSIGDAVNRHVPGSVGPTPWEGMTRFDTLGNFTHEFFRPFALTLDFAAMRLYVG